MEKFLLLVRRYLGGSFALLRDGEWEEGEVDAMVGLLGEGPLVVEDWRASMGLRYHVIDIYVDELERVGALGGSEDNREGEYVVAPIEKFLEPLRNLAKDSPTKTVRLRAKEALNDERLPGSGKKPKVDEEELSDASEDTDDWGGCTD